MELKAGSQGNVRPEEVLRALSEVLPLDPDSFDLARTALIARDGRLLWDCGKVLERNAQRNSGDFA
jgi:hypothetical protein